MKNTNNRKKQKGFGEGVLHLIILVVVILGLFFIDRIVNPELHSSENDFKYQNVHHGRINVFINNLEWYDYDDVTSYYVFTDQGKLKIDGNSSDHGFFNSNDTFYGEIEEYVGYYCNFTVEKSFLGNWLVTRVNRCEENLEDLQ